jgi:hypothetical protein
LELLEIISLAYQPWNIIFLSQQISFSRLISRRNHQPNSSRLDMVSHCQIFRAPLSPKDMLLCSAEQPYSPVSSCKEEEKTSLLGFLDGLSQASALNTSWKNDTNCCLWEGVTCNTDGAVMDISLASMGLEGHISPSLGNLTSLLMLNLSGNSLSGELPLELLWSSSVVVLDVSFKKLNGEFHKLPSTHELAMKVINISSKFFTGYLPSATLGGMKNLATLNISNNSFTGKFPSTVCVDKPFFVVLDLSYNQFNGGIPPARFWDSFLKKIRTYRIGRNSENSDRYPLKI